MPTPEQQAAKLQQLTQGKDLSKLTMGDAMILLMKAYDLGVNDSAECCDGALVDCGYEMRCASVKKESITDLKFYPSC